MPYIIIKSFIYRFYNIKKQIVIITNSVVPVNRLSRSSLEANNAFVCIFPAITIVRLAL